MLELNVDRAAIHVGPHFTVQFERTLRIPDDANTYPLPPSLGAFPIYRVRDYADRVPEAWNEYGGVFIPMYQREALWLSFGGSDWCPSAVKVAAGHINAVTGKRMHKKLNRTQQNYLVTPDQPWLDGINAGKGYIRQFVAMPLGGGYTVEEQLTGKAEFGGLQMIVYAPKEGIFEEPVYELPCMEEQICAYAPSAPEMGLGAGGKMEQKIYPDEYGVDVWDTSNFGEVYVHIVNSQAFHYITGHKAPSTPISAETYTDYGLPWFRLYDECVRDIAPADTLAQVKTINEVDRAAADEGAVEKPVELDEKQIVGLDLV